MNCSCANITTAIADACAFAPLPASNLGWYIGAIFFVLVGSAFGVFLPLLLSKSGNPDRFKVFLVLGKHIGTGALLSLGFIHLLFPAIEQLGSGCLGAPWTEYPFALLFAMVAALLMHALEIVAHSYVHNRTTHSHHPDDEEIELDDDSNSDAGHIGEHFHRSQMTLNSPTTSGHTHGVLLHSGKEEGLAAFALEIGLAIHSIIIGISLGIAAEGELAALIPALSFHQMFEGFALGSQLSTVGKRSR